MDRYQENFQRASCLILKRGTRAKRILLEHHLTKNNLTLGMFLQQNKHDIYHCYHTTKCCQCKNGYRNPKRRVLNTTQMELIFEDNGRIQGHSKGIGVNKYCCRDVRGFLCLESFDITLLNFLLTNFCLNTFLQSCLLVGDTVVKTLEMFLNENKHALFHFWKKTKCCVGGCVFQNTLIFNTCQWNSIYDQLPNSCQNVCSCSYQAKDCIEESSIDKDLLGQILQRTCPLKIASDNIVETRNTVYSHASDAAISDNEFKRVFDECTASILTIYESCKADVNQEEFEINLIRNMKYSAELQTEYQNMLLQQIVNNNNIEEELFRLNGRIDQIQIKDETVYAVVLQNSHGLDEMNERLARLEKLCTNKELPEPVDHVDCYFDSEDGDLVTCGRCGTHFHILDEFKRHKRLCKNERESKKFKVEVRNMDEQWETGSQTFIRKNRNLFDTEHIKIDNAKSGSLVMIGRITLAVFSSSDVFINSITTLLSKLFRYNPPEMEEHMNFEVDVNVLDTDTADDVDVDIYHCGLCKKDCSGVSSFIDHKESLEHIQKREGKKGYTTTTTTSDHACIPTEPPSCDSIYKGNQPKETQPNYTGYDTRSGQPEYDPNSGRPRNDHRTGHAGFDPRTGQGYDPRTGQPVYDPRTGQYQITPNPGQHFPRCKGNNSYKKEPDHASLPMQPPNYESIYKGQSGVSPPFYMGHAEYDQRSGQPAYDPNSGQPGYDPRTGQPGFDPRTGQGYDPRTGQPVYDPRTGQYQITLNPGQQKFYPQQWPPYNPNDEKQAEWHGHWHGGNPPPPGYGYPGYPYGFQGYQGSPGQGGQQGQFDAASNPSSMPTDLTKEYMTEQEQAYVDSVEEPEQEEEAKTYQLKVSKLPPKTTEDSLQFFFENTRKSGGGDVESVEYDEETSTAIITFEEDDDFANGYSAPPKEVVLHEDKLKSDQPCQKDSSDDTNAQTQQSTLECFRSGSGQKESQLSHDANLTSILQPSSQQPTYDSHQGVNRLSNMHPTDELSSSTQSCKQQKSKEISNVENGKPSEDIDPTNKQCSSINNSKQHYPQSTKEISPGENVNHSSDTILRNQADQLDLDPIPAGNQTGYDQSKCAYPLGDVKDLNKTPESTPSKKPTEDINAHPITKKTRGVSDEQASTKKKQEINIRISNKKSAEGGKHIPITGVSVLNFACNFTSTSKQKINISDPKEGRIEEKRRISTSSEDDRIPEHHKRKRELPTPVMDANVIKLLGQAIDSIGIIKGESHHATCWRVGTDLIFTAWHVVRDIIENEYITGKSNEMKLKTVRITFGRTTDTDSKDDTNVFEVEPSIPYHNESLDTALLRLKPNGKRKFPQSFRNFYHLVPERDEKEELYLIGYQKESQEINSKVEIWNPTEERLKSLEKFCEDNVNKGYEYVGYSELDNSDRIVVKCEFRHGASGCPGFVIVEDKLYVVTIFLRGFPAFFYANNFESKRTNFPKDKLFQQGVKIGAIKSHLEKHNRKLYDDIFQDQMNKDESNHRNQLVHRKISLT